MSAIPFVSLLTYIFALWFSMYLLTKHTRNQGMRLTGCGILAYALGLLLHILAPHTPALMAWRSLVFLLPAAFWYGAIQHLIDAESADMKETLGAAGAAVVMGGLILTGIAPFIAAPILAGLMLLGGIRRLWQVYPSSTGKSRPPLAAILTATVFFGLGVGAFALPAGIVPPDLAVIAIGVDLALLGVGVAVLDAYEEGERLRADFLRSLAASMLMALIFGGQVVVVMLMEDDFSTSLLVLLIAITSMAVVFQTSYNTLQTAFDRLVLPYAIGQQRAELRQAAEAATRVDRSVDFEAMDEAEFTRLVRRALSHLGDPGKLASSPLTQLPMIDEALHNKRDSVLERVALLKALLVENIMLLKPRDTDEMFGITDEWRYFLALYYPYVVGLKPYSRRAIFDESTLDSASLQALYWLQTHIPERTLYNWQNAAAEVIAKNLRGMLD